MEASIRLLALGCLLVGMAGGCTNLAGSGKGSWGAVGELSMTRVGQAAKAAALRPQTWVPVLTAGVLIAADVDERWSRDLADDQPLFGADAEDVSHDLRDVSTGAYVLTALLAPSDSLADKATGLALGASTMIVDGVVSRGLKDLIGRERPDRSNDNSIPSGHASKSASRTAMALRNLSYLDMPDWSRNATAWALHGVALGTGLARVEARKHHLSDVLVGYAIGQFIAEFMYRAFLAGEQATPGIELAFQPVPSGGALTISVPLR